MFRLSQIRSILRMVAVVMATMLVWPASTEAQLGGLLPGSGSTSTITGQAAVVRATVLGLSSSLADTGTLSGGAMREASLVTGSLSSLVSGEALHAVTLGWPDQVASEASLTNLNMSVAGVGIVADVVMARASQVRGAAGQGSSVLSGLRVNGIPVNVTGLPNQVVFIPGGQIILNEQSLSSTGGMAVNAVHVVVGGVANVVVGSATAGIS